MNPTDPTPPNRRNFARLGAGLFAAMAGVAVTPRRAAAQAPPNLFPNANARQFQDILENENAHLPAVTG